MDLLFLYTTVVFFIWVVRNILYWIWLWQAKDYRFDVMRYYLTYTTQGRDLWFSSPLLLRLFGIVLYIPAILNEEMLDAYHIYVALVFSLHAMIAVREVFGSSLKVPTVTMRTLFVFIPTITLTVLFWLNPILDTYLWLLLIDRLALVFLAVFLFALAFPSEIYRDLQIENARKKLHALKNLKVISVTGSIGKEATVYMTHQLLSSRLNGVRTQRGPNTIQRIAFRIEKLVTNATDFFVAQVDAYKKGEIFTTGGLLRPNVAVITSIIKQSELLERQSGDYKKVHMEIINVLSKNGLLICNGNDAETRRLYKQIVAYYSKVGKIKKISPLMFYFSENTPSDPTSRDVGITNVLLRKRSLSFDLVMRGKSYRYHAPLLGRQSIEFITPSIIIARKIGIPHVELRHLVSHLIPLEKHMIPYKTKSGSMLVDETHPTNVLSMRSILEYMTLYKGKKILVFTPMIDLNKRIKEEHYVLAKKVATTCDYFFVTNKHFNKQIIRGFYEAGGGCTIKYGSNASITSALMKQLQGKDDVAVFIGEEAAPILQNLLKRL